MIVGIQQLPGMGTGIGVQLTAFVSFACTSVSFAISCVLLSTMGRRVGGHVTNDGSRGEAAEHATNDSEPRHNNFHPLWTMVRNISNMNA
jgi:hypothetical protein